MTILNFSSDETKKLLAWQKAEPILPFDPNNIRKDRFGAIIVRDDYGKTTEFGWEIDHVQPLSLGGLLAPSNEIATHWKNSRSKSNNFIG